MAILKRVFRSGVLITLAVALPFTFSYALSTAISSGVSVAVLKHRIVEQNKAADDEKAAAVIRTKVAAEQRFAVKAEPTAQEKAALQNRHRQEALYATKHVGWKVQIELISQGFGGPNPFHQNHPANRTVLSTRVGEWTGKERLWGSYKIVEIIDDDQVRVRFGGGGLVAPDPAKWTAQTGYPQVGEAVISRKPLWLATDTICGGSYFTYTLLKIEEP